MKHGTVIYQNPTSLDGILVAKSGSMTLIPGISPSAANITTVAQDAFLPATGTLTFSYSDGSPDDVSIVFMDCAVNQASHQRQGDQYLWNVQIFDRRWKWRYGTINGEYNKRDKDGSVRADTEKTPQELADLLFTAMGETDPTYPPDYSLLPNDARPYVQWDNANPARELANLCESLGCYPTLQLDNTAKIWPFGTGTALPLDPSDDVMEIGNSILYEITPSTVRLVGSPIEFQSRLVLEAVGLDTDDEIYPIEELTYFNKILGNSDPIHFADITSEDSRQRAVQSVYRWYRVVGQIGGGLALPGGLGTLNTIEDLILLNGLVQEETIFGTYRDRKKPIVLGTFYSEDAGEVNIDAIYTGSFSVDASRRLLRFSKPVYQLITAVVSAAELYVEIGYNARVGGAPLHYERDAPVPGVLHTTQPRIIEESTVFWSIQSVYDATIPGNKTGEVDNGTDADTEADYYLDAELANYAINYAKSAKYSGLLAIDLDGLVRSVSWSIGGNIATTNASTDPRMDATRTATYDEIREVQRQQDFEDRTRRIADLIKQERAQREAAGPFG